MFCHCMLLFGTIWIIFVKEAEPADILQYWDPDQQFEARRKENNLIGSINNEKKTRFQQAKATPAKELNGTTKKETFKYRSKYKNKDGDKSKQMTSNLESREFKSTQSVPFKLMEQEKPLKADDDGIKLPFILSPYACVDQIKHIISNLTDADVQTEVLGRTASYNDILLFKISQKDREVFRAHDSKYVENETKEKKIIFIVHALSTMGLAHLFSLTYENYLEKLISYYLAHLDNFDIYLIPIANPDGLLQARKVQYWNKNFSPNFGCPGVDVDRNFDVAWNTTGEVNPCSQHYPGHLPFSEPESRAVRDVFHRVSHKIIAYFHVHGGTFDKRTFKGDAVLYPKGYTDQQSDDDHYMDLKGEIDEAIKNANFKVLSVTVDTLYNWYGQVFGTSVDYAATVYGIPFAMEMVMQLYQDPMDLVTDKTTNNNDEMEFFALTEIWRRVIDATFRYICKKTETNDAA